MMAAKKMHRLSVCTKNQIEAQNSGFDLEMRHSGMSAL